MYLASAQRPGALIGRTFAGGARVMYHRGREQAGPLAVAAGFAEITVGRCARMRPCEMIL